LVPFLVVTFCMGQQISDFDACMEAAVKCHQICRSVLQIVSDIPSLPIGMLMDDPGTAAGMGLSDSYDPANLYNCQLRRNNAPHASSAVRTKTKGN